MDSNSTLQENDMSELQPEHENTPASEDTSEKAGKRFGVRQLLPLCFMIISAVWIYMGVTMYGFWDALRGGRPGFIPVIVSSCLLFLSILALLQSYKEKKPVFMPLCFIFLLLGFAQIALGELIGLQPAMLLFVLLWLKVIEKAPWKGTLIVLACLSFISFGIFQFWLNVPFPKGILYPMIANLFA